MSLPSRLRGWLSRRTRTLGQMYPDRARQLPRRQRPELEALEDRVVPAFNLTISTNSTVGVIQSGGIFAANATGANINVAAILFQLNVGNDITISNGTTGTEAGNITWLAAANLNYQGAAARSLTVTADPSSSNGAVALHSQVSTTTTLNETFNSKADLTLDAAIRAGAGAMILASTTGGISETGNGTIAASSVAVTALDAVTLDRANDVTTGALAAAVTGIGQGFTFTDANDLTIGTVAGVVGISTSAGPIAVNTTAGNFTVNQNVSAGAATIDLPAGGGESLFTNNAAISNSGGNTIDIEANRMALNGAATSAITAASGGRIELDATLAGRPIDLGATTDPLSILSLSDAELDTVSTTGVLQIGDGIEGSVTVSAAIGPNNVTTLTIFTAGGISGAGAITVANLRLSAHAAVSLTGNSGVGVLAGAVQNSGASFTFHNAGALTIGTVDTVAGITTNGGDIVVSTTTSSLTVNAAVAAGAANITLTAGAANSNSASNVVTINANVTASANGNIILNGNSLVVNTAAASVAGTGNITANFGGAGGTATFNNGAQVTAVNGAIAVTAATSITLNGSALLQVSGSNNITLTTNDVAIASTATISASDGVANANNIVTIRNFTVGQAINLGSNSALGLTDAELDRIQAEVLRIGRNDASASGTITIRSAIDLTAGANTIPTLHLLTGADVVDGTATEQTDLTVGALAIQAVSGIGSADDLDIAVGTLAVADTGAAASGNIQLTDTGSLTISSVDGVSGVQRTGGSSGNVVVTALTSLTVNAPAIDTTGGNITLTADTANSNSAADVLTVNADVTASGGAGNITLNGNSLVVNAATVSVAGAGNVTMNFGGTGGAATFNNGSTVSAADGLIDAIATTDVTLNGSATLQTTGAGNLRLTTDDIAIANTATISTSNVVTIRNFTAGRAINLGTNTTLGLTDAELDRVGAGTLIVGRNDASAAGAVTLSASIDLTRGAHTIQVLHVLTGAGLSQSGAGTLSVGMMAVEVGTGAGIGAVATPILTETSAFAANAGSGGVFVSNHGALTIGAVAGVNGITATGGAVTIANVGLAGAGPITVTQNIQTPGDITLTAQESTPAVAGDNLSVNSGATINSTAGNVLLRAGDILSVFAGAVVQAAGTVTLIGGFNDDGNGGGVVFLGTATGTSVSVQGGAGNDSFTINPTSTAATLSVDGLTGSDTFTITPNAVTTINVVGDLPAPPATPGDVLSVNTAGATSPTLTSTSSASGLQGSFTFGNRMPVNFQQIETLATAADLAVTKTAAANPVPAGHDIAYTLTLTNLGGVDAQTVSLSDAMPANTTFVSFAQTSGPTFTLSSPPVGGTGNVMATIATLGAGQSATFTLVVHANAGLANNTQIANSVTVSTATAETSTANNTATAMTKIGPVPFIAVGAEPGTPPRVAVFSRTGALVASFLAYPATFRGGVRVAVGDVNGDGTSDIIVAGGPGARVPVRIIDGTKLALIPPRGSIPAAALLGNFFAYPVGFTGGLFVAAGDVNGDGRADIVIGAGGTSRVKVIDAAKVNLHLPDGRISPSALLGNFLAYSASFTGGVTVAAGDVNGDGRADVIVGPASGAQRVEVIDGTRLGLVVAGKIANAALLARFFAFQPAFAGGVFVAAGAVNADGKADIIVAPASAAAPLLRVIDANRLNFVGANGAILPSALLANQLVFASSFRGGVRVGAIDLDNDGLAEILVGAGPTRRRVLGLDVIRHVFELNLTLGFDVASLGGA
jgi:Domain of unknown function DUF11/FG-GAP-like repeat